MALVADVRTRCLRGPSTIQGARTYKQRRRLGCHLFECGGRFSQRPNCSSRGSFADYSRLLGRADWCCGLRVFLRPREFDYWCDTVAHRTTLRCLGSVDRQRNNCDLDATENVVRHGRAVIRCVRIAIGVTRIRVSSSERREWVNPDAGSKPWFRHLSCWASLLSPCCCRCNCVTFEMTMQPA